ncbi:hypothetical protein AB1Y20_018602 [Prymnesium parvum]|uniref:Glycosyltransferase family 61 protein n=1 Tax=Prymnesium parvum TaxID=97485 RepID=A0AB34JP23_PRYPA
MVLDELHTCDLHSSLSPGGLRGLVPSLLGPGVRRNLGFTPRSPTTNLPVRVAIVSAHSRRRIRNELDLIANCPQQAVCEILPLDGRGALANIRALLDGGYHAMIALHGAAVANAAFVPRPFAILEVKPSKMRADWFQNMHQTAFALDTWTHSHFADRDYETMLEGPQKQAAELPLKTFQHFVCMLVHRLQSLHAHNALQLS